MVTNHITRQDRDMIRALVSWPKDTQALLRAAGEDSEKLLAWLKQQKLAGYIYARTSADKDNIILPDNISPDLKCAYEKQQDSCSRLMELAIDLKQHFDEAGVTFILMKGFHLSETFIGGRDWRHMFDLDLLVEPEQLTQAMQIVLDMGLQHKSRLPVDPRKSRWGMHAVEFSGGKGRKLDLHCTLRNLPGIKIDLPGLWRNARPFDIHGHTFQVLADEDLVQILTLGIITDLQVGHQKIRKLLELYLVLIALDETLDWKAFLGQCADDGTLKLVINGLSLCIHYLDVSNRLPRLVEALSPYQPKVLINTPSKATRAMSRGQQHILNRLLVSRMLPVSLLHYWSWWLGVYVPMRLWNRRMTTGL